MKEVLHTFTVKPQSKLYLSFPIDMLRSDHCYPATENDSATIGFTLNSRRVGRFTTDDFAVTLCRYAQKQWVPTSGRWKSFGWEVDLHGHVL